MHGFAKNSFKNPENGLNSKKKGIKIQERIVNVLFSLQKSFANSRAFCVKWLRTSKLSIEQSRKLLIKGTLAQDFWPLVFFMNRPLIGP